MQDRLGTVLLLSAAKLEDRAVSGIDGRSMDTIALQRQVLVPRPHKYNLIARGGCNPASLPRASCFGS
jgi:hypothetical protein